jgi:oxygen-dependent protoporphyrinogen oxidase
MNNVESMDSHPKMNVIPPATATPGPRIAIVGAGISGLSLAWHLERMLPGCHVELFEASDRVGGVIQTKTEEPFLAELGADNFATLVPYALRMVEEMGLRNEFFGPKPDHRIAQVVRDGKVLPIPNGFSLMQPTRFTSVLFTPTMSLSGRLRLISEYFVKQRTSSEDESVESFAVRRLGQECFDRLVEPIVAGIFTARAETLSMQAAMPQFVSMEKEHGGLIRATLAKSKSQSRSDQSARQATGARYDQFLAPKNGMSWWIKSIASSLNASIHCLSRVSEIQKTHDGKWELKLSSSTTSEAAATSTTNGNWDAVCLALPSHRSANILKRANSKVASMLERIPYASSAVAILALNKSEIHPKAFCFGVVVPKMEHRDCLAISLSSEKYSGRCPDDTVLARVFMGGAIRPEMLEKSDEQVLAIARKEVQELLGVTSLPRWQSLVRWNEAMPQYLLGHKQLVAGIRDAVAGEPSLRIIGNAFDGVGIPQCIKLARETAEHFAAHFKAKSVQGE